MDDIYQRLKSLGIQVGARDLPQYSKPGYDQAISVLGGTLLESKYGTILKVNTTLELPYRFEKFNFPNILLGKNYSGSSTVSLSPSDLLILDIETTGGLGVGGAACFLIGVGKIQFPNIELIQFVLLHPQDEFAQLLAFEAEITKAKGLVSYNGKSFDIPILTDRFRLHHLNPPFEDQIHIDLLHTSRRIWKDRLPNRALRTIEAHILDIQRDINDIPGWMIPQIYQEYLRTGDYSQLVPILYHNKMDVVSLANLFLYMAQMLTYPDQFEFDHIADRLAVAKYFLTLGFIEQAKEQFSSCLCQELNSPDAILALESLGNIYKSMGNLNEAVKSWETAAEKGSILSHIELAKYYEHKQRNPEIAKKWTEDAINLINSGNTYRFEKLRYEPELKYRLERLVSKIKSR